MKISGGPDATSSVRAALCWSSSMAMRRARGLFSRRRFALGVVARYMVRSHHSGCARVSFLVPAVHERHTDGSGFRSFDGSANDFWIGPARPAPGN